MSSMGNLDKVACLSDWIYEPREEAGSRKAVVEQLENLTVMGTWEEISDCDIRSEEANKGKQWPTSDRM